MGISHTPPCSSSSFGCSPRMLTLCSPAMRSRMRCQRVCVDSSSPAVGIFTLTSSARRCQAARSPMSAHWRAYVFASRA